MTAIQSDGKPVLDAEKHFEDSYHIRGFVQKYLGLDPAELYKIIEANAQWVDREDRNIHLRGTAIMRDKETYVEFRQNHWGETVFYAYRYTGWQYGLVKKYRPMDANPGAKIVTDAFKRFTINGKPFLLNHAITTRYRDAEDNIGFHQDKIKDIQFQTPIVSLSLGERREMHIADQNHQLEKSIVLESGDAFVLGWNTNLLHQHAIVPVKDETTIKRPDGYVVGPRISVVARQIRTTMTTAYAAQRAEATNTQRAPNKRKRVHK